MFLPRIITSKPQYSPQVNPKTQFTHPSMIHNNNNKTCLNNGILTWGTLCKRKNGSIYQNNYVGSGTPTTHNTYGNQ